MSICIFLITSVTDRKCSDHFEPELEREKEEEDKESFLTWWWNVTPDPPMPQKDTLNRSGWETWHMTHCWHRKTLLSEVDWETRHTYDISYCCRRRTLRTEVGKLTPNTLFPLKDNVNCGGLKNVTPDIRTAQHAFWTRVRKRDIRQVHHCQRKTRWTEF